MTDVPVLVAQTWRVPKRESSAALLRKVLAASGPAPEWFEPGLG